MVNDPQPCSAVKRAAATSSRSRWVTGAWEEAVASGRRYLSSTLADVAVEGLTAPLGRDKGGTLSPRA